MFIPMKRKDLKLSMPVGLSVCRADPLGKVDLARALKIYINIKHGSTILYT